MPISEDEIRDSLSAQLVKLADLMETCDPGDANHREYSREYKKVAKALYPDMYKGTRKQRRPTPNIIKTLMPCDCGAEGWMFIRMCNQVKIKCRNEKCERNGEFKKTNPEARDSWNQTFTKLNL